MEVVLLGTGSAEGWPHPWCRCASCRGAAAAGEIRTPAGALVDGRVLLECGPETPRQAVRHGLELAGVRTVLVTHVHTDHFDPAFLYYRSHVTTAPLRLVGPAPVIRAARDWVAPTDASVQFVEVRAGDEVALEGHRVRVLPAHHRAFGEAVLYAVSGRDGRTVLWACDTGLWAPGVREGLAGLQIDLALVEETWGRRDFGPGHLNLDTFPAAIEALAQWGALAADARVVAIHLGHHNPWPLQLPGAELLPDGSRIVLSGR